MTLILTTLITCFSFTQDPKIKKLDIQSQVEIFNSIDYFKQYHSNSFKVNLFRRTCTENMELNGFPLSSFIIAIYNYSEDADLQLYEVGNFYKPEIIEAKRQDGRLKIILDHGKYQTRTTSIMLVTKSGITLTASSAN